MKNVLAVLSLMLLAGCATSAAPNFVNGRYYMAGDSNCQRYLGVAKGKMLCADAKGRPTGYRNAMSVQDMQMYQMQQMQQQMQEMYASAQQQQQLAAQLNQMAYTPPMAMPTVAPLSLPGSGQVRCISTGFYTNCRY